MDRAEREKIEYLEERIRYLESLLASPKIPVPEFGFTPSEAKIYLHLLSRNIVTYETLNYTLRDDGEDRSGVIRVHLSRIRKKIRSSGMKIKNYREVGWGLVDRLSYLTPPSSSE
jgi:DNA-binding response OmpR family regulator